MQPIIIPLLGLAAMLISLTVHEFSHAMASLALGDHTAKRSGRLTLNPMAHIDPIGTVLIPLLGALSGLPIMGWAKPVPFNPYNLRFPKFGPLIVALAGPISNFLSASVYLLALKLAIGPLGLDSTNLLVVFLTLLAIVNIVLGVFNFIPVPPLDGSNILRVFLDHPKHRDLLFFLETKGSIILFAFIMIDAMSSSSILGRLFGAAIGGFFGLFGFGGMPGLY
jgi:Zn-dependent protease